ncbi:hypothetical protein A4X13_0g7051 [Tilletia indica]|uniref:Uncharacterized protein n=1 Tax=Tilletia indica TaxID=43049 RepID=A0A177T0R4_9BASI|nr:hypothetical protein A4X13_0g7051 [Tilletia indica]
MNVDKVDVEVEQSLQLVAALLGRSGSRIEYGLQYRVAPALRSSFRDFSHRRPTQTRSQGQTTSVSSGTPPVERYLFSDPPSAILPLPSRSLGDLALRRRQAIGTSLSSDSHTPTHPLRPTPGDVEQSLRCARYHSKSDLPGLRCIIRNTSFRHLYRQRSPQRPLPLRYRHRYLSIPSSHPLSDGSSLLRSATAASAQRTAYGAMIDHLYARIADAQHDKTVHMPLCNSYDATVAVTSPLPSMSPSFSSASTPIILLPARSSARARVRLAMIERAQARMLALCFDPLTPSRPNQSSSSSIHGYGY